MDNLNDIRTIALRNVLKADKEDYLLRKIFRSYSIKFSTPLHQISDLPLEDVFMAFFEDLFENMEKADLEEARLDLIETEEEIRARQKQEDQDDAELFEIGEETVKQEGLDKIKLPTQESKFKAAIGKLSRDVELINSTLDEVRPDPGIKMTFDDTFDESDLDRDSFGLLD